MSKYEVVSTMQSESSDSKPAPQSFSARFNERLQVFLSSLTLYLVLLGLPSLISLWSYALHKLHLLLPHPPAQASPSDETGYYGYYASAAMHRACVALGYHEYTPSNSYLYPGTCTTPVYPSPSSSQFPLLLLLASSAAMLALRSFLLWWIVPNLGNDEVKRVVFREKSVHCLQTMASPSRSPSRSPSPSPYMQVGKLWDYGNAAANADMHSSGKAPASSQESFLSMSSKPITYNRVRRLFHFLIPIRTSSSSSTTRLVRRSGAYFRLIWCFSMSASIWVAFGSSNWWPSSLGGGGSTLACWDLSGSLPSLTRDFDGTTRSLLYFYVLQMSYHVQSFFFSLCSLYMLPSKGGMKIAGKLNHAVELALLAGTFVLSSTRRLGMIAIFAMNGSQASIDMYHILITSEAKSPLLRPRVFKAVHFVLIILPFFYLRFYIIPFEIFRSVLYESQPYLLQIQQTTLPWTGDLLRLIFNTLLAGMLVHNLVYGKRILGVNKDKLH